MYYAVVRSKELNIFVYDGTRNGKIRVSGRFYRGRERSFDRYFDNLDKAMKFYNKMLDEAIQLYVKYCQENEFDLKGWC